MNRGGFGGPRQGNNFMGGGGGGGGGLIPHNNPPNHLSIGTSTNNQDPAAKASRIFIGNLNPLHSDRQKIFEIFREYGTITGMSIQKGYGFIQFTSELEARAAVEAEHGRRLGTHNAQHLDLRVASEPDENRPVGFKRAFGEYANFEFYDPGLLPAQPSAAKRRRFQDPTLDDERSGDEPPAWMCSICKHVEVSPWELMKHAAAIHQLLIYDLKAGNKGKTGNGTM
ncbi:RNA-binding Raly-like protein [Lytechinus pictus]|uniref:RNA-binding Raly-like protein n=1 Tax=Lytechinus pictus TaxID=7653 RepID=UPI00240DF756|nr:RNA-binding Raly-like protein [Lytechinus pictus]XP_054764144.1 RNA-binding Raly-like protein [Lytechinus pictus]